MRSDVLSKPRLAALATGCLLVAASLLLWAGAAQAAPRFNAPGNVLVADQFNNRDARASRRRSQQLLREVAAAVRGGPISGACRFVHPAGFPALLEGRSTLLGSAAGRNK